MSSTTANDLRLYSETKITGLVTANWEMDTEIKKLIERIALLEAALTRIRDCDWVITLPDRMDAVRDIARAALLPKDSP